MRNSLGASYCGASRSSLRSAAWGSRTLRTFISVSGPKSGAPAARVPLAPKSTRKAYFPEARGYVDTPVYDRYALQPGAAFQGPAIIEERESTTIVDAGAALTVNEQGFLFIDLEAH